MQEITGASTLPKWCDNWLEYLYDESWKEYFFDSNSNVLYKIEKEELQLDYFAVGEKKSMEVMSLRYLFITAVGG